MTDTPHRCDHDCPPVGVGGSVPSGEIFEHAPTGAASELEPVVELPTQLGVAVPEAVVLDAARDVETSLLDPEQDVPTDDVRAAMVAHIAAQPEHRTACQSVWSSALASVAPPMEDPFVAVTREQFRAWQSELADARRLRGEVTHEVVHLRSECASQAAEIEQLRADLERANFAREKLAQTIAACPEGHHDANLAHARAERDRLRAEVAQYEGGRWVTEYGAVNDMTGEFVPFSWACTNHPDAARAVAETVGKEAMQQRVWRGKPEPIPATEADRV